MMNSRMWPDLGFGVGLRSEHFDELLHGGESCDWLEAISENFMDTRGRPLQVLETLRRDAPVALHGVALSIGSVDPLNDIYLQRLADLAARIEPALITDHLCWTGVDGTHLFDLLPLPYTDETLRHVVERTTAVQDRLGRRILLENPSTYVAFADSDIPEWEFLAAVAERADCGILLDVNNVYVSAFNLGFDAAAYVDALPVERIGQIHLAGFTDLGDCLFDTHSAPVHPEVWRLYERVVRRCGRVSTLVEWDADIPSFASVRAEAEEASRRVRHLEGEGRGNTAIARSATRSVGAHPVALSA